MAIKFRKQAIKFIEKADPDTLSRIQERLNQLFIAGVVMPDHVHLLIQPWLKNTGKFWTIGSILHSIKGFSVRQVPGVMPHIGKLWQDGHHERLILSDRHFQATLEYIPLLSVSEK